MANELNPKDFADNRRGEPRTKGSRMLSILPCRSGGDWKFINAELVDCSLSGLGLLMSMEMPIGAQFLAKLRVNDSLKMLLYTVQNCRSAGGRNYRIGARFSGYTAEQSQENPERILEALLKGE